VAVTLRRFAFRPDRHRWCAGIHRQDFFNRPSLTTDKSFSVYSYDKDTADKSACDAECGRTWKPLIAPQTAQAQGDWSILERSPGVRQWSQEAAAVYVHVGCPS